MLEDYYVKPSTIDKVRGSWLAPQIESYLEWLQAHGYSRLVVYRRLPLLFHFAEFAQKKDCGDIASCKAYIKEFVSQWLDQHGAKAKTPVAVRKHAVNAECGVRQMLQLACKEPVTRNRRRRPFPLEAAVPGFAEYLRGERGFAESTIRNYRRHLSEFAQYLSQTGVTSFSQLSPPVLAAFVVEHTPKMAPRTRLALCCHLRVLLRFCHREGITSRDLSGAVGTPQVYRLDDVLRSITWDDVRRMLEAAGPFKDRRLVIGSRGRIAELHIPVHPAAKRLVLSMTTAAQAVVFKRCAVAEALSVAPAIGQRKAAGNPVRSVLGHFNGGRPNLINLLAGFTAVNRETKGPRGTGSDGVNNVV